jgi:hypothetical protein
MVDLKEFPGATLSSLVTADSSKLFSKLQLSKDFMNADPAAWQEDASYRAGQKRLLQLKVVNDVAERAVALAQHFNGKVKRENQMQYLLQCVEAHRKLYPDSKKSTLVKPFLIDDDW